MTLRLRRTSVVNSSARGDAPGRRIGSWSGWRVSDGVLAVFALWFLSSLMLIGVGPTVVPPFALGQRAPSTVVALCDFEYVDLAQTDAMRMRAAEEALPVFQVQTAPLSGALSALAMARTAVGATSMLRPLAGSNDTVRLAESGTGATAIPPELLFESAERAAVWFEQATNLLVSLWMRGLTTPIHREQILRPLSRGGRILVENGEARPRMVGLQELLEVDRAADRFAEQLTSDPQRQAAWREFIRPFLQPNLEYAPLPSERERRVAVERVSPVTRTVRVGTTLVQAGERVTAQLAEILAAHERELRSRLRPADVWLWALGSSVLLGVAAACTVALVPIAAPEALRRRVHAVLLAVLGVLTTGAARLVWVAVAQGWVSRMYVDAVLPVGVGPLLAVLTGGAPWGAVVGVWCTLAVPVFATDPFHALFRAVAMVTVAVVFGRQVRQRSHVLTTGIWMGLAGAALVVAQAWLTRHAPAVVAQQAIATILAGLGAALLVLWLLPPIEAMFRVTSDLHLIELSNPSHPLLNRLAMEAPGTYHHSLVVANLAHAAAQRIGAHGLLARVGALYHDVGKLVSPNFFIENISPSVNPHAQLPAHMSAAILKSHVKEGLAMARQYRLPWPVAEIIEQHHGSSLIAFFYERARQSYEAARALGDATAVEPDISKFRYEGAPPQSREAAIIMLADAVEAAVRSLPHPTAEQIAQTAAEVVRRRFVDGDLDESPLTAAELRQVVEAFTSTLTSMYHGRVVTHDTGDSNPQSNTESAAPRSAAEARGVVGETSDTPNSTPPMGGDHGAFGS